MRWIVTLGAMLAVGLASPAAAQGRRTQEREISHQLGSESPSEVRASLEALGLSGNARAVTPIAERIRRGLPPDLLDVAIDTLSILGRPEAGPVLFDLTHHRRPAVRLKAVQAIAGLAPPGADRALIAALGDRDAAVRGAAAEGLGSLGATSGVDALFTAMERDVPEAPVAIGRIARPADVERFLGHLGRVSFDALVPALSEMLHRDELADAAKLAIVHRLTELATPGARQLLEDFVNGTDEASGGAARRAAAEALPRISQ